MDNILQECCWSDLSNRYGLHLKVIHNDVTDRLTHLLKQCSYYLQQQQKPVESSLGKAP